MKLFVFTDPHGSPNHLKHAEETIKKNKVDAVICCGDITIFEQGIEQIIKKMDSWNVPIFLIHGNHEDEEIVEYLCEETKNIQFVHKKLVRNGNLVFLGFGGDGFSLRNKEFEDVSKKWIRKIHPNDFIILFTHQPPFGAVDEVVSGQHTGSESIRMFIEQIQPQLAFCGHIHDTFGEETKIGETRVVNTGPKGRIYDI